MRPAWVPSSPTPRASRRGSPEKPEKGPRVGGEKLPRTGGASGGGRPQKVGGQQRGHNLPRPVTRRGTAPPGRQRPREAGAAAGPQQERKTDKRTGRESHPDARPALPSSPWSRGPGRRPWLAADSHSGSAKMDAHFQLRCLLFAAALPAARAAVQRHFRRAAGGGAVAEVERDTCGCFSPLRSAVQPCCGLSRAVVRSGRWGW